MAKKSAIKRLAKRLVKSEEAQKVIDSDNEDYDLTGRHSSISKAQGKIQELQAKLKAAQNSSAHQETEVEISDAEESKDKDPESFNNFQASVMK
jgi:recombinational DNA repair protein RecT